MLQKPNASVPIVAIPPPLLSRFALLFLIPILSPLPTRSPSCSTPVITLGFLSLSRVSLFRVSLGSLSRVSLSFASLSALSLSVPLSSRFSHSSQSRSPLVSFEGSRLVE